MLDSKLYGLEGKTVIVTGSGVGIGKGIALEMAKAGANVVVTELDSSRADAAVGEIREVGSKVLKVLANVTESEQVDKVIQQTLQEFGTVDILVNNVGGILGVSGSVPFLEMSEKFWDGIIEVNLKGTFLCTKAFVKTLIDQKKKGSIINLSSLAAYVPWLPVVHYGGIKAAVINLTMTLAVELGQYNIRVNSIAPGRIETALTAELYRGREEVRKAQIKWIPLGRLGLPEDVGRVAVFLVSDAAGYVSGQTIGVGGGLTYLP